MYKNTAKTISLVFVASMVFFLALYNISWVDQPHSYVDKISPSVVYMENNSSKLPPSSQYNNISIRTYGYNFAFSTFSDYSYKFNASYKGLVNITKVISWTLFRVQDSSSGYVKLVTEDNYTVNDTVSGDNVYITNISPGLYILSSKSLIAVSSSNLSYAYDVGLQILGNLTGYTYIVITLGSPYIIIYPLLASFIGTLSSAILWAKLRKSPY